MSATLRERYDRLYVEIDLYQPIKPHIVIGSHKQIIEYEVANLVCKKCGKIGPHHHHHFSTTMNSKVVQDNNINEPESSQTKNI